jgi:uncharacterized protein (TIGR00369 family)
MDRLPPYARFLGISTRQSDEGDVIYLMPFADVVLGRPGYLHGGAIAGLLELAAFGAVNAALDEEPSVRIKPINVTVNFMRGGGPRDTFAHALVTRLGKRIANVEAHAWQLDRGTPIAAAQFNMLLRR